MSSSINTPSQCSSSKSLSRLTYEQIRLAFPAMSRSRSLDFSKLMSPTSPVSFMTPSDHNYNNTSSTNSIPSSSPWNVETPSLTPFDPHNSKSTITTNATTTANLDLPRVFGVSNLDLPRVFDDPPSIPPPRYLGKMNMNMGVKKMSLDNGGGGQRQDEEDVEEDFIGHSFSSLPPNPGDFSRIAHPDIKESPQLDLAPSKIHSIRSSPILGILKKPRCASTPIDVVSRFRGFSSTSVFGSDPDDYSRSDLLLTGEDEPANFRKRSEKHLDAGEKLKWTEKCRSMSLPIK